jgi:hypothetical protein
MVVGELGAGLASVGLLSGVQTRVWHFFSFRFSLRYCSTLTGNLTATTSTRLLRVLKYCIHSDFWTHTMIHIPIYNRGNGKNTHNFCHLQ